MTNAVQVFALQNASLTGSYAPFQVAFRVVGEYCETVACSKSGTVTGNCRQTVEAGKKHWKELVAKGYHRAPDGKVIDVKFPEFRTPAAEPVQEPVKDEKEFDVSTLSHFSGSEEYYPAPFGRGNLYTQGMRYVADNAGGGAYWLIDAVFSYLPRVKKDPKMADFSVWFLRKSEKGGVVLTGWADTGKGNRAKIRQEIPFTNFPIDQFKPEGFKMYLARNGSGHTLMLASEY